MFGIFPKSALAAGYSTGSTLTRFLKIIMHLYLELNTDISNQHQTSYVFDEISITIRNFIVNTSDVAKGFSLF